MPSSQPNRAARACTAAAPFLSRLPIAALAACLAPALVHAQGSAAEQVVITANRTPQPLSSVLADISIVDRVEIEKSGAQSVAEVLARLPGIEFIRNGGPGASTSVFIRGGETRHTAVYIDGMRGVVERNAMRYYLAIDAYIDSLGAPAPAQVEQRIQHGFTATERHPRQLREMDRPTYVALKRVEYARQQSPLK